MTNYNSKISVRKIPSDKNNSFKDEILQNSSVNYQSIQELLKTVLQAEKNKDIQAAVQVQIDILEAIREFKILEKREKLEAILSKHASIQTQEKAISQLQNQVLNLEKSVNEKFTTILKSVDEKFTTTLKSVENSQAAVKTYAQIASQNQSQKQETSQKKIKNITKSTAEQVQKENHDSYEARRLILHVKAEMWKNFNSFNLRNQINDAFLQKENIMNSVIASVTRSRTGFSIVLITMTEYNADFLLEKQQIWAEIFSQNINSIEKSVKWYKLVVHGVSVLSFSTSDDLSILRNEIEIFNPDFKLLRNPSWLSSEENRQNKRHESIVFAIDNAEQAEQAIKKKLYIAESQLVAENYKSANIKTQCQKCQKFDHSTRNCINQECCQICAEKHYIRQHKCHICQTINVECSHAKLKCRNCDEDHRANSQICSIWEKSSVISSTSSAKSDIVMKNNADFAVVIFNTK